MVEGHLDVGGAVAFWALADWTDRDKLRDAQAPLGLASVVPDPRPPSAVLRDALSDVFAGPRLLVRPLAARDGFAVVREDRGADRNAYDTELVARVTESDPPGLTFDPDDGRAVVVRAAYGRHSVRVPAVQVSAALVKVVESLDGTRLRPTGAVYWVPGHKLDDWAAAARAVEAAAAEGKPSAVYVLRHRLDADAVRAVRDAVVAEVSADARRLTDDVTAGDLGTKALEARRKQAGELRSKVLLYEDVLSVGLSDLHAVVDAAGQAAASAALLVAAAPVA